MTETFVITAITYVIAGMIPPLAAGYLLKATFLGGIWTAIVIGLVASFSGGLVDTFLLSSLPDLIPVGAAVDAGPPLVLATVVTLVFALVSKSN